jgi:hypothetical protein
MWQEVKVYWNEWKPIDMLELHDTQCGFLKMLVNPLFLAVDSSLSFLLPAAIFEFVIL